MKKNIVICCEEMLHAIAVRFITPRLDKRLMAERADRTYPILLTYCPWCRKKLPFPYEGK